MRRGFALLAVCTVLWVVAGVRDQARSEQATQPSTALDLVILIDDSNSMYDIAGGTKGNDPNQYRREAAIIMLNMCETTSSRAAVISFGGQPRDIEPDGLNYDQGLLSISGDHVGVREKLAEEINSHEYRHTNTDVKKALQRALTIFNLTPPIQGNRRVILLLSDNKPYVRLEGDTVEQAYARGASEALNLVYTSTLFNPSLADSVKIDVVELLNSELEPQPDDPYYRMAEYTGGSVFTTHRAEDLPTTFTEMLAQQIGSTLSTQSGKPYDLGDGRYAIPIRLPNQSVTEANLLLSMKGVKEGSVRLFKPLREGQNTADQAFVDGKTVFYNNTKSFVQFKITKPRDNGTWHLIFTPDPATAQTSGTTEPSASITVLFSYNLTLHANLTAADCLHDLQTVGKNDKLTVEAWFTDLDGNRSTDRLLYQSAETDASASEAGICAYAYALPEGQTLTDANATPVLKLSPTERGEAGFTLACRPADLGITKAGAYRLYVYARGEGLARELPTPIPFSVLNQAPAFSEDNAITLTINDPADEAMNPHTEKTVCLKEDGLCEDGDEAVDSLSLYARSEDERIVRVLEDTDTLDDRVTLTAVRSGETNVVLTANDGDTGGAVQKTLPVQVVDVSLSLQNRYEPEIIVENTPDEDGKYTINETLRLWLHVRDRGVPGVDRDGYALTPSLTLTDENGVETALALTETPGREGWSASLDSGLQTRDIRLSARVLIGRPENRVALAMPAPLTVRIINRPPVTQPKAIAELRTEFWVEPNALSLRREDQPYVFPLELCFTDDDPSAYRTYFACLLPGDAAVPATPEEAAAAAVTDGSGLALQLSPDGVVTFSPLKPGKHLLVCAQTDAAGQTAMFTLSISVRSISDQLCADIRPYLIAALLFLAAVLIVRQVTRPSYQGLSFSLSRNGNFQVTRQFADSKKKMTMSPFNPFAANPGCAAASEALSNLTLKPGRNHTLRLRLKKATRNNVSLGLNVPLRPRRWVRMKVGYMLTLKFTENGTTTTYGWKLVLNQPTGGAVPGAMPAKRPQPPSP